MAREGDARRGAGSGRAPRIVPPGVLGLFYVVLLALPLGLAAANPWPRRPLLDEIAAACGLLAFVILLSEFPLAGRFGPVSRGVGMDATMRLHRMVARIGLALALVHPFLYTLPFNPARPWDPTRALTLTGDIEALLGGIAAFVMLPGFVVLAIHRAELSMRYEWWRALHGVGALVIVGAVLHHTLEAGRYSADPVLAWVWIALSGVAVAYLGVVYVAKPLAQLQRPWRVASVRPVAERTWELALAPQKHAGLAYEAGQFAWINVGHSPFSLYENPFSISSTPASGCELQFVIKEFGDFSGSVGQIRPGTRAWIDGPHGNLVITGRTEPGIALIAGGVGVAPLIAILRELVATGDPRPSLFVYGNRAESQIAYREELATAQRDHGTEVVHVLSEPPEGWEGRTGLIDEALLRELFAEPGRCDWLVVLCGPTPMLVSVERTLRRIGLPRRQILAERFDYD